MNRKVSKPGSTLGRPNSLSGVITRSEFYKAHRTTSEGGKQRGSRNGYHMNIRQYTDVRGRHLVDWTCPRCGHRSSHLDLGRDIYVCLGCQEGYDLKVLEVDNVSRSI